MEINKRKLEPENDFYPIKRQKQDITQLPTELIELIMKFSLNTARFNPKARLRSIRIISRLGAACKYFRSLEKHFWGQIAPISRIRNWSHISHMPKKYRTDPKQIYLYEHFSCVRCGKKAITEECYYCQREVCYDCEVSEHECSSLSSPRFICPDCTSKHCFYCKKALCRQCDIRTCFRCNGINLGCVGCIDKHEDEAHPEIDYQTEKQQTENALARAMANYNVQQLRKFDSF